MLYKLPTNASPYTVFSVHPITGCMFTLDISKSCKAIFSKGALSAYRCYLSTLSLISGESRRLTSSVNALADSCTHDVDDEALMKINTKALKLVVSPHRNKFALNSLNNIIAFLLQKIHDISSIQTLCKYLLQH